MLRVTINGRAHEFPAGLTILDALRQLGLKVPTLCHDERLKPGGACRLCEVEIAGWSRYATACNTPLASGMVIQTHSPASRKRGERCWDCLRIVIRRSRFRSFPKKNFTVISGNTAFLRRSEHYLHSLGRHSRMRPIPTFMSTCRSASPASAASAFATRCRGSSSGRRGSRRGDPHRAGLRHDSARRARVSSAARASIPARAARSKTRPSSSSDAPRYGRARLVRIAASAAR